ncbi:Afadin and alpha-actinin-binding-domain-containing protein [Massariosphaeria phaeospora]|uniref:Afadin and alpha-actinin-binding-domain-containing protein n=1 Tax=Massariosphaeria phaeospora TaxID=100035 RepID=A0A7C8I200_9PLEO|nr:Afadin and alpha-actinin-binding-domain-containing protein [Massariosphaeria phaeospora]
MAYTGPSFSLHVKITIAPENVQKFLDAAEVAFGLLADEPELTFFQMYQSADEPGVFKWVENWNATREWFLTVQIQKEYYKPYMAATEPLFIKPREVEFYERMQGKTWNVYKEGLDTNNRNNTHSPPNMETFNLKTASTYINNLLLARGLLRDGKPIEFAHPSRSEGGKEVTMAQIINLVHDLILKRDRDQEHRESLAAALGSIRTEATRQTIALERAQTRNADLARQLSLAQSQERSARAALRAAESSARGLREEMLRLKTTVQQVRTSCANDIRKRDVQIQRLKSHLTSQQRGNKTGLIGASITINPGTTGLGAVASGVGEDVLDVEDPEYSLKQETTEFLTQLSQSLSDENDNLIGLVRSTLTTLKDLQGMPEDQRHHGGEDLSTIGEENEAMQQGMLHALPTSYETLAGDMDTVLDNLKNLLTNPNFVSVDEVELREEEIVRLRAGWEKMETRWRDTLSLMESWRKRIVDGGDTINLEELKVGLGFGAGLETVNEEEVSVLTEADDEAASSVFDEELAQADDLEDPPSPEADEVPEKTTGSDIFKLKLPANPPALRESSGNIKSPTKSPRKVAFSASIPNTPSQMDDENKESSEIDLVGAGERTHPTSLAKALPQPEERVSRPVGQDGRTPRQVRCDDIADQITRMASKVTFSSSPSTLDSPTAPYSNDDWQAGKRLSSPHAHPEERSPKLSVHDKLQAAQAEAEVAAVAEGLRAIKSSRHDRSANHDADAGVDRKQKRTGRGSPVKTRITGRPRRRQSTLTPDELQAILGE